MEVSKQDSQTILYIKKTSINQQQTTKGMIEDNQIPFYTICPTVSQLKSVVPKLYHLYKA